MPCFGALGLKPQIPELLGLRAESPKPSTLRIESHRPSVGCPMTWLEKAHILGKLRTTWRYRKNLKNPEDENKRLLKKYPF